MDYFAVVAEDDTFDFSTAEIDADTHNFSLCA
jgi:hypothetical protein